MENGSSCCALGWSAHGLSKSHHMQMGAYLFVSLVSPLSHCVSSLKENIFLFVEKPRLSDNFGNENQSSAARSTSAAKLTSLILLNDLECIIWATSWLRLKFIKHWMKKIIVRMSCTSDASTDLDSQCYPAQKIDIFWSFLEYNFSLHLNHF